MTLAYTAMTLPALVGVWDAIPLLRFFQFPHRFLAAALPFLAYLAGAGLHGLDGIAAALPMPARVAARPGLAPFIRRAARAALLVAALVLLTGHAYGLPRSVGYFKPLPEIDVAFVMEKDRETTQVVGEFPTMFIPATVEEMPPVELLAQDGPERLDRDTLPEGATMVESTYTPLRYDLTLSSPAPFQARFRTFYFPGWQARIDGQPADVQPTSPHGLVSVDVPAGEHRLEVWFGSTPVRTLADVLSACGLAVIIVCVLAALPPARRALSSPAAGGAITVTTTLDEYDSTPNGTCSLREAIQSINTSSSFGGCANPGGTADTVVVPAGTYTLTISASPSYPPDNPDGALAPSVVMTIRGAGSGQAIISGGSGFADQILHVYECAVWLEGLTVRGGASGGIEINRPPLSPPTSLVDVVVKDNSGGPGIEMGSDGDPGIEPWSALQLHDVVVRNNSAGSNPGAALRAGDGGHITVTNSIFHDNSTNSDGGGIYFWDQYGGDSYLHLTNVTIYSNTAGQNGGGIYAGGASGAPVELRNVTLAGNGAGGSYKGGNLYNAGSMVVLINTIVASGTVGGALDNCDGNPGPGVFSLGHNLEDADTCGLDHTSDLTNTNPLLADALADNGGPTPSLALLAGSPAIDQGDCSAGPTDDQRGYPRLAPCDIGAYEYGPFAFLPLVLRSY